MKIEIRILSGALANTVQTYEPSPISVGRGPEAGLRLHPTLDLSVSVRHAILYPDGGRWWVRDLQSQNGTYHNGRRLDKPARVSGGDRITFGRDGPEVEVIVLEVGAARAAHAFLGGKSRRARRRAWMLPGAVVVIAVLVGIISVLAAVRQRELARWDEERAALLSRLDSVLVAGDVTLRSLEGEREGLAVALRAAQDELRGSRAELERALSVGDRARVEDLRRELQARTAAVERQQLAASLDFAAIERANRRAVAMVYVETGAGDVLTATAFAVRADGVLLTSGHVVGEEVGPQGPGRIGVQFSDSEQVFPARLLAVDSGQDLALLAAQNIVGEVPVVRELNRQADTLGSGAPVAVIGFPLGGVRQGSGGADLAARPLVSSGVIAAWHPDRVEIQGYGAAGASGSPVFDADGRVVAILFGGIERPDGRRILGVPARAALRLMEEIP